MGGDSSKNEKVNSDTIIENEVTQINGSVSLEDKEIMIILLIICFVKVIEFIYMIYKIYHRKLKRKIENKLRPSARNTDKV
jgi:hypothetical protein